MTGRNTRIPPVELVTNGSATTDATGWSASAQTGTLTVSRATGVQSAWTGGAVTALDFAHTGGSGSWAYAVGAMNWPQVGFKVGATYRVQAWVRDVLGTGLDVGLLVADSNYNNRPTGIVVYEGFSDTNWHLISRTFVCTGAASSATGLYLAFDTSATFHWQVSGASIQAVEVAEPAIVPVAATTTITFAGSSGSAPSSATWNHVVGAIDGAAVEAQTYTTSTTNCHLDGSGNLVITAKRETVTGPDGIQCAYTSARINTDGKLVVPSGSYVEASIKAPVGAGLWPAFWLVGANIQNEDWPACGELDILEVQGSTPTTARSAVHVSQITSPTDDNPWSWGEAGASVDVGVSLDANFHTYGCYFDGETARFYVDRVEHLALWAADAAVSDRAWPFSGAQSLILNVAVDSTDNPGGTSFPRSMTVGTISIWQGGIPFVPAGY